MEALTTEEIPNYAKTWISKALKVSFGMSGGPSLLFPLKRQLAEPIKVPFGCTECPRLTQQITFTHS